jgi:hypothetical protein
MILGNLANEVIFKKAFTDKFVLQCLVRNANKITYPFKLGLLSFNFLKKSLRSRLCRDFLTR